jgi:hypothetical protein
MLNLPLAAALKSLPHQTRKKFNSSGPPDDRTFAGTKSVSSCAMVRVCLEVSFASSPFAGNLCPDLDAVNSDVFFEAGI